MTLKEKLDNLRSSGLETLRFKGEVLGLRIRVFNPLTCGWGLYDFSLDVVRDTELKAWFNAQKFVKRELIETDTSFCTQDELDGLKVLECKTEDDVRRAVAPLMKLYSYGGVR